jgi:hypothetical protein
MLSNFDTVRPKMVADCEYYVIKRRSNNAALYQIVEEYIAANNLIVSTQYRRTTEPILQPFVYDLYTDNCKHHAITLANKISVHFKYTQVSVTLPTKLIRISVDCVTVVSFYNLMAISAEYKHIYGLVPIKLSHIDAFAFPAEIELIEIYRRMYNLSNVADWPALCRVEASLYDDISFISGGFLKQKKQKKQKYNPKNKQKDTSNRDIIAKLTGILAPSSIFIGFSAMHMLHGKNHSRIQCITTTGLTKLARTIKEIVGRKYTLKKSDASAPYDYRLERLLVLYKKQILAEIYNSAKYEPIPVIRHAGYIIGAKYVLLRFAMLELYLFRVLCSIGALSEPSANALRGNILAQILKFAECGGAFTTDYIGTHKDFQLYCRKTQQEMHVRRYEPRIHLHQHGAYMTA